MKKSLISLLVITSFGFGMISCGGTQKSGDEKAADNETAAVIAGSAPRSVLTAELKQETALFLKDMPDSEIPYRLNSKEITIGVGDMSYMLPVSKAAGLTTATQKARACGMYFADYNIKKATGQPVSDLEGVLVKLTTDLNISFVQSIMQESAPANATEEQFRTFMKDQENRLIDAMIENDKMDVQLELVGGMAVEYACLLANPSLVIKGDATSAGLSQNMERRLEMLGETASDLSVYYPDLADLQAKIIPLKDKVGTINEARSNRDDIMATRDALLK